MSSVIDTTWTLTGNFRIVPSGMFGGYRVEVEKTYVEWDTNMGHQYHYGPCWHKASMKDLIQLNLLGRNLNV